MKKLGFIVLSLVLVCSINAQKIHRIIFADTNDSKIGEGVQVNVNNFLEFTLDVASGLGMENACESAKVFTGSSCSKTRLTDCINNFSCGPEDIVIFGYFGHGGRSKDDPSEFPQMCLGSNNPSDFVPLEDVKDALVRKGARFVFVTGDCCNNYASISKKRGTLAAGGPTTLTSSNSAVMKKLFGLKGSVTSSGCQKGEYSWINSITGGFFTNGFLEEFENYLDENPSEPNWNKLFEKVRSNVVAVSRERLKDQGNYVQTPIWKVETGGTPHIDEPKVKIDDGTIRSQLLKLVDKSVEQSIRKGRIPEVKNYFTPNCVIEIYGKGGETLLGVKNVDGYLRTITSSPFLNNFVIQYEEKDASGKIKLLRVHEIYVKN